jgi:amino acid adenylation domain-containing protein
MSTGLPPGAQDGSHGAEAAGGNSVAARLARLTPQQRAQLAQRLKRPAASQAIPLAARESGRLPMSAAQQRLYFLQKLHPESPAYNNAEAVRLSGPLDLARVRAALAAVVRRHEVLRTICRPDGTVLVAGRAEIELEVLTSGDPAGTLASRLERPFDLDTEFPLRVTLLSRGPEHFLLFVVHHVVSDAWSCRLLVRDFFAAYGAGSATLTQPSLQYGDYAAWLATQPTPSLDYWRARLAGLAPVLELPLEQPRPALRSDAGAEIHTTLDSHLRDRLHQAAREAAVTPFALLLIAFGHVLHRHCATTDVVIGVPVSGRDRPELEDLMGCFINTLPIRLDYSGCPGRRELVRRLWQSLQADLAHQSVPFEALVAEFGGERMLSTGQLVQVMFNHYPATEHPATVAGLELAGFDVPRRRAKFDLTCTVVEGPAGLRIAVNYGSPLLSHAQAARISEHFVATLTALMSTLDAPDLPPGPISEPAPALTPPANDSVLDRFEAHALAHPGRIAIRTPDSQITYRDLDQLAAGIATGMRTHPPGPAGILMDRGIPYVATMLAALKAGRAYVPFDPVMPATLITRMATTAATSFIVNGPTDFLPLPTTTAPKSPAAFLARPTTPGSDISAPVRLVPSLVAEAATHPARSPAPAGEPVQGSALTIPAFGPEDEGATGVMYVLFTSGSTGEPKGVVVEHRQVTTYLDSVRERMGLVDGLHYALVSTLAADLGMTNLYGALTTGGTLHLLPYEWAADPERFAEYFREHPVDVMKLVPSHLGAMAEAGVLAGVIPARHLVLAGEACRWDLVAAVRAAKPGCVIWNHYGPTETTVSVLAYEVPAELPVVRGATVPLGQPLGHVRADIVDGQLRPVPQGAAGELLIGGHSVARGYLGQESDRFIPDPFSADPAARVYRSGDRARVRDDGAIEFLGRLDRQVKIRGYRVEPGQVESVLRELPGVAGAAVLARPGRHGRDELVAYYVSEVDNEALPSLARARLAPYQVPSAFVRLECLPLTPNGKLDWRALPAAGPDSTRAGATTGPRDARDADLCTAWAEVLGVPAVGIDDDFFDLGGDSFLAMRLVRRLGDGLRVVSLFQHPTVREFADFLGGATGTLNRILQRLPGNSLVSGTGEVTVIAVPFGGGTPVAFRELAKALPARYSLYAVDLPGHDLADPGQELASLEEIAARCHEEIRRHVTGPIVVYGHCVGAALAFLLAQRLHADGFDARLVAGGAFPDPRLPSRIADLWARVMPGDRWRSDRLYRDTLRASGGLTELLSPAEQKHMLRALRHDVRQSEELYTRLCHDPEHDRRVPALCVAGERDRITEFYAERYQEWNLLCASTEVAAIPEAGHYFHKHQPGALADIIDGWVAKPLPAKVSRTPKRNLGAFALVSLGQLVSMTGSRALAFALGVWVYLQTGSVTQFSVILVSAMLPGLLALPLAGAAADRWNRRWLMMGAEAVNLLGTGICLTAYATGNLALWHIYLAAGLGSVASSFQQPAYLAAVAQLVPKHYLSRTNGILQAMLAITQAAGPLLGGALLLLIGLGGVMLLDLATVVVALLTLIAVRFPDLLFRRRDESLWQEIGGGLRYITRRPSFVAMIVFFLGYNLTLGLALALLPPMVLSFGNATTLSTATVAGALGGIAGGIAMALWGGFSRRATGMIAFVGLTGTGLIVAAAAPSPSLLIIGLAAVMGSISLINGHWQTMIQIKVGMELQGRILATNRMVANLTEPVGYVAAALLADALFEPAMRPGGPLASLFGPVLGTGPGRGMALLIVLLGLAQIALAVAGLRWKTLHRMEDVLPDAIPGPVLTWDREQLQREADRQLTAAGPGRGPDGSGAGLR